LLERLSVFAGGFDLEAAEAICGADPLTPDDVLDLLTSLVEKSLVMTDESDGGSRYRQLETIREFAREYLGKRDDAAAHAVRHCDYFLLLAKASNKVLQGAEQAEFTRRLEVELDNLRAAIALALNGGADPVLAVKFEVALMWFRLLRGYSTEGRKIVRAALAQPAVLASDVAHAHALYVGAALADNQSDYAEAGWMLEACLALRRGLDQPFDIAATLSTLSQVRLHEGDTERARETEEEALGIFRKIGDRIGEAVGLFHLGEICRRVGDDAKARDYFEQCLAIARAIDSAEIEGESELVLGAVSLAEGDLPAARARFARSLEVCRGAENKRGEAMALWWTGKADAFAGNTEAARQKLGEALRALQTFEMNSEVLSCLEDHAELLQSIGSPDDGVSLFAAVETLRERLALARPPRDEAHVARVIAAARATLGDALFDEAWAEGRTWELEQATRRAQVALSAVAA
jgi:non-specific serine/threonine protein kinase